MRGRWQRLGLAGALAGCEPAAEVIEGHAECVPIDAEALPGGAWLVEGDVTLPAGAVPGVLSGGPGPRSAVKCGGALDRTWDVARRLELSYCLVGFSDAALRERAAEALGPATAQWERAGGVNFIHRAELDGDERCASPEAVAFVVRQGTPDDCGARGCPLASASFPPDAPDEGGQLVIWPSALESRMYTIETVLLHELGHLLGLVHEHSRFVQSKPICVDAASQVWRALTFPDPASVMGDARCPGISPESTRGRLSAGDRLGAWTLYAPPRRSRVDYDGDGAEDVLWFTPGGESYALWYGGAGADGVAFSRVEHPLCAGTCPAPRSWRPIVVRGAGGRAEVWMFGPREIADERWTAGRGRGGFARARVELGSTDVPIVGAFAADGAEAVWWLRPGSGSEVTQRWARDGESRAERVAGPEGWGWPLVGRWRAAGGREEVLWLDAQRPEVAWWPIGQGDPGMAPRTGLAPCGLRGGAEQVATAGDFDGDGLDEALWWDPRAGTAVRWRPAALWDAQGRCREAGWSVLAGAGGLAARSARGDFDGDGADDVLWYAPGEASVWRLVEAAPVVTPVAAPTSDATPCVGDYDGDGCDDVLWHGPEASLWRARCAGAVGFAVAPIEAGPPGAAPVGCGG